MNRLENSLDRGLQYGDGFFTTILLLDGQPLNWQFHWQRIVRSCEALHFPEFVEAEILQRIEQEFLELAIADKFLALKIIFTRGIGAGYGIPKEQQPNIVFQFSSVPVQDVQSFITEPLPQISAMLCQTQASINPALAGVKHLNRLDSVLARTEVLQAGFDEGIMFANQTLICGTQTNILLLKDQTIFTPDLTQAGVAGTALARLKNIAQSFGLEWRAENLSEQDLAAADAVVFCNALRGLQQAKSIQFNQQITKEYQLNQLATKLNQIWWQASLNSKDD